MLGPSGKLVTTKAEVEMRKQGFEPYDIYRKPKAPIEVGEPCKENFSRLRSELKCVICQETLRNTMVFMNCLHRFCRECIKTSLRNTNKYCPSCRTPCGTHRSLRPDHEMDELIAALFPGLNDTLESEEKQRAIDNSVIRSKVNDERKRAIKRRKHLSASELAGKGQPTGHGKDGAEGETQAPPAARSNSTPGLTNFGMFLHPEEKALAKLSKELLRTPGRCPIWRMKRYVADRIEFSPYSDLDICVLPPVVKEGDTCTNSQAGSLEYDIQAGVVLDDDETIDGAGKNFWEKMKGDTNLDLVLHYRKKKEAEAEKEAQEEQDKEEQDKEQKD